MIPEELSGYFSTEDFSNYPFVRIPQVFEDFRGRIVNLADGRIGDVAIISTEKNSVRANHFHQNDWHLCYLIEGKFDYFWEEFGVQNRVEVSPGEMVFTPKLIPHKIIFGEKSIFISVSKLSRISTFYESDTTKLKVDFFFNAQGT